MAITNEDIVALASAFHDASMVKKSTAAEMAEFFLYPESRIFVLHGGDLTLQANYEIHRKLVDEIHWTVGTWDITPLSDNPERVRAQGIVYWQGRHVDSADGALLKCYGRGLGGRTGAVGRAEVRHLRQFLSPFSAGRGADRDQVTTGLGEDQSWRSRATTSSPWPRPISTA
jgi:hypothetical protein